MSLEFLRSLKLFYLKERSKKNLLHHFYLYLAYSIFWQAGGGRYFQDKKSQHCKYVIKCGSFDEWHSKRKVTEDSKKIKKDDNLDKLSSARKV